VCRNRCAFRYALTVFMNDLVDQAVLLGLLSRHNEIALHVLLDFLDRLAAVVCQELVDHRPHPQNLLGVDVNIGCLARKPRHRGLTFWVLDALVFGAYMRREFLVAPLFVLSHLVD
jgi:hypothetical protein